MLLKVLRELGDILARLLHPLKPHGEQGSYLAAEDGCYNQLQKG